MRAGMIERRDRSGASMATTLGGARFAISSITGLSPTPQLIPVFSLSANSFQE